jgi:hypothetical protein
MINNNEEVAGIYLQTFAHHWAACQDRLQAYEPLRKHWSLVSGKPWVLALETLGLGSRNYGLVIGIPGLVLGNPGLVCGNRVLAFKKKTMSWLWPRVSFLKSLVLCGGILVLSLKNPCLIFGNPV